MADLDLSILDRVKKRLLGPPAEDTQVIPNFESSILFTPTDETQRIGGAVRLPQLELDQTDFAESTPPAKATQLIDRAENSGSAVSHSAKQPETQLIGPAQKLGEATESSGQTNAAENAAEESRATRLAALVEQKRQERMRAVEEEEAQFQDGPAVDSSAPHSAPAKTQKELEDLDKLLHTQKRSRPIAPAFTRRAADPLLRLVAAFDSDTESPETDGVAAKAVPESADPTPQPDAAAAETLAAESLDDELNVLDLISVPVQPAPQLKRTPIDEYAQRLQRHKEEGVVLEDSDTDAAPEVPQMTKEQILEVKKKYSRRPEQVRGGLRFHPPRARAADVRLADQLRRANTRQLRQQHAENPDAAILEEIDQEEEEMSTLLEREMERVRRIRRRERAEAAAAAEAENDAEYAPGAEGAESDVSVPDSEDASDEEGDGADEGDASGADADTSTVRERRRARRVVESAAEDDESGNEFEDKSAGTRGADLDGGDARNDDSYMFGGHAERDDEDDVMPIQSDAHALLPMHVAVPTERSRVRLFENLVPRAPAAPETSFDESMVSMLGGLLPTQATQLLSGTLLTPPDELLTQLRLSLPTEPSGETQATQPDAATQPDDESDDDFPAAVHNGRLQVQAAVQEADAAHEAELQADELAAEKLAQFEARIRQKELRARRRRKELERRGIGAVVEGEAEESEDEWKGIGGADVDESDQADSEDERMIDNNFNLDLNDEEVRRKFMEQYRVKDHKELEKLMDDIKNHRLTKRARAGKFDIELSDEEDELLMAYRRQKLQEQKLRLLANQKAHRLTKNDRASAFFESIHEESVPIQLDDSDAEILSGTATDQGETENDEQAPEQGTSGNRPRRLVLEESFVQKQLSFLSKTAEDDYASIQSVALNHQADDDVEDLAVLKSRSLSNLYSRPESQDRKREAEEVQTDDDDDDAVNIKAKDDDADDDDDDDDSFPLFKKPSVVSSFRSFTEKRGVQVSSQAFSGVTVSKQYKVASGSKASISYMSKASVRTEKPVRSLKVRKIQETIDRSRTESNFFSKGAGFS